MTGWLERDEAVGRVEARVGTALRGVLGDRDRVTALMAVDAANGWSAAWRLPDDAPDSLVAVVQRRIADATDARRLAAQLVDGFGCGLGLPVYRLAFLVSCDFFGRLRVAS